MAIVSYSETICVTEEYSTLAPAEATRQVLARAAGHLFEQAILGGIQPGRLDYSAQHEYNFLRMYDSVTIKITGFRPDPIQQQIERQPQPQLESRDDL